MQHCRDRVPLFGQDDGLSTLVQVGEEDLTQQKRRQRSGIVGLLALLAVIDPGRMVLANPLAPAMEMALPAGYVAG